jgi:hypothetical protein
VNTRLDTSFLVSNVDKRLVTTIIMNMLRSRFGLEGKQHAPPAGAENIHYAVKHATRAIHGNTAPVAGCSHQQQQREQQQQTLPARTTPPHMRALSLACACLVAIDSGLPLAALADVPQQQQHTEKHGLLGRLRQMVSPTGDGECLAVQQLLSPMHFTHLINMHVL